MKSNTPIFIAKEITAGYGEQVIIRNINLELYKSTITTIIGPNGCGKSTFLKSISGIINPFEGNVFINDIEVTNLNTFELSKIAEKNNIQSIQSKNLIDALKKITTNEKKIIVIFGSLYLVGSALSVN